MAPYHLGHLIFDRFCNIERIAACHCPLLIIHGKRDELIPPWHSQHLFDAAATPQHQKTLTLLDDADHNMIDSRVIFAQLTAFMQSNGIGNSGGVRLSKPIVPHEEDMPMTPTCAPAFLERLWSLKKPHDES
jgi:fermentation-respiration switch protein FrsA (DUF1100 family)